MSGVDHAPVPSTVYTGPHVGLCCTRGTRAGAGGAASLELVLDLVRVGLPGRPTRRIRRKAYARPSYMSLSRAPHAIAGVRGARPRAGPARSRAVSVRLFTMGGRPASPSAASLPPGPAAPRAPLEPCGLSSTRVCKPLILRVSVQFMFSTIRLTLFKSVETARLPELLLLLFTHIRYRISYSA